MKRIWFTQQKPFNYMSLRAGLGLITERELHKGNSLLCPKIYTTRTRKMSGEYYVVEGSRFKAQSVEPRIVFQVKKTFPLNLRTGRVGTIPWEAGGNIGYPDLTFPELDLGIKNATFKDLRDEILKLTTKATIDTPFYINRLEPLED